MSSRTAISSWRRSPTAPGSTSIPARATTRRWPSWATPSSGSWWPSISPPPNRTPRWACSRPAARSLARWAERLALGDCLRLGRGEAQTGGHAKESVLATALEAVLGAVYREAGLPGAARVIAALALW